jgi:hypothetical protein
MLEKLKAKLKEIQEQGLYIVFLKDPITKQPSVTLSLLITSAIIVITGLLQKPSKLIGGIDIENSLSFFYACAGIYLGRKITGNKVTIDNQQEKK